MTRTAFAARFARWNAAPRLTGIDLARGLAVIGMLAAHLLDTTPFDVGRPDTWVDIVNGRSSILFALLAGVSISLVTGGPTPVRGRDRTVARGRLVVRAGILWVLGLMLIATGVPVYVILPAYAILFLIAMPLVGLRARTLAVIAAALALVMPIVQVVLNALPLWSTFEGSVIAQAIGWHYPFPVWSAFLVAGMAVGRLPLRAAGVQARVLAVGAVLAVAGYGLAVWMPLPLPFWSAEAHSGGTLEVVGSGGFALAVIGACLLVCRTPATWLVLPLRAVGSMPLTAYAGQIVAWAIAAFVLLGDTTDLAGFRALEPFWPFTLVTVAACTAWALLVGKGPLETLTEVAARPVARIGRPYGQTRAGSAR